MSRIHQGWSIVAFQTLVAMLFIGATSSAFGLYVVPVSKEYGLSRADMNTTLILISVGAAVFAPVIGWLLDRAPVKPLVVAGAVLVSLSLAALSQSPSVLVSALIVGVFLTAGRSMGMAGCLVLVVRWFEANRGRALTLGALGTSLGGVLVAPGVGLLIGEYGWRTALLVSGAVVAGVVIVPALLLRMTPTAEQLAQERQPDAPPRRDAPSATPLAARAVLRMPQFWLIGVGFSLGVAVAQAQVISMVPMAMEQGMSATKAATLVSAAGVMSFVGKLLLAVIADKVDRILMLTGVYAFAALGSLALFTNTGGYPLLLACAALVGLANSLMEPLRSALVAERFGAASFGTAKGLMAPIGAVIMACGLRFAGEVFDRTGAYTLAFLTFAAINLLAASMIFSVRFTRPKAAAAAAGATA